MTFETFLSNYQRCVRPSWVTRRFFGIFGVLSQKSYSNTLESYWICNLKVTSYLKNWQKLDLWDLFIKLSALRDAVVGYSAVFRKICCFISKILFQHFREFLNLYPKVYKLGKRFAKMQLFMKLSGSGRYFPHLTLHITFVSLLWYHLSVTVCPSSSFYFLRSCKLI